jgi:hypothetical protein
MLTDFDDEECISDAMLRLRQEREIRLGHSLTEAEHELAIEAQRVGLIMAQAGIPFDPLTFIALRVVEGSLEECVDPINCLAVLLEHGFLERSVELAAGLLEDAA